MLSSTRTFTVNCHRLEIQEGTIELKLSPEHRVIGFAPPRPEPQGERLDVCCRPDTKATLLVEEAPGNTKQVTKFRFVPAGTNYQVTHDQRCLGSVWHPETSKLYLLIGVGEPLRLGGAC